MKNRSWGWLAAAGLVLAGSLSTEDASACGGFFCSQSQGVNQAAERIVFADNGDGTVTAVIEIMYQGPADEFSWLLPISSVPQGESIQVGSSLSLQRLQQATNPQYSLQTVTEGNCDEEVGFGGAGGSASVGGFPSAEGGAAADGGVTVEASGLVGSFEWAVISLDASLTSPALSAVNWLNDNGYDVPEGAPALIGPYLEDGLYLLALKLQKGADAGSIRPIVLTYDAKLPMIPIKLTAVAANDDMGVLTWLLGAGQAVPKNYYALELNEARINWFNPNPTYNDVVIAAANEASGQGFVTEYAQPASALRSRVWFDFEEQQWAAFQARAPMADPNQLVVEAMRGFSQWDGFWEVVRKHVQLPPDATLSQVQECPECFDGYVPGPAFVSALEDEVIEPARVIQELLDRHEQVTRLYSTLSAEEMTVDPLFTFNPGLPPVSNVHTARRVVECAPGFFPSEAPWRIELPQGGVVRGGPDTLGQWPQDFAELPANLRILRRSESGEGDVLEDNTELVGSAVDAYSATVDKPKPRPQAPNTRGPIFSGGSDDPGAALVPGTTASGGGCGCQLGGRAGATELGLGLLGALASLVRLKRRRRGRHGDAG